MDFWGCPSFTSSFMGNHNIQRHEILLQNTRDFRLPYGENPKSLSHLVLERYWDVTDTKTNGQRELLWLICAIASFLTRENDLAFIKC